MSESEDDTYEEDEEINSESGSPVLRFQSVLPTSSSERFWSQTISATLERRMDKNLNDLEFAWGMKRGTLNLDTRSNVFCLSAKFKALWENYEWILLPEDHILEQYYRAGKKGQEFPDIGEGPYKYRFFVHPDMKFVAIHRQITFPEKETGDLKPDHFLFSSFPFTNLGTLTSHIHPRYVICHIGARTVSSVTMFTLAYVRGNRDLWNPINKCMDIAAMWTPYADDKAARSTEFIESWIDPNDVYSETSDRTANCRLRPHMSDRRLIKECNYVYVKEDDVKLKYKEDAPHLLTAKKLLIFEDQMNPREAAKSKRKTIQLWRSTVSGDPEEHEQIDDYKNVSGRGDVLM